MFSPKFAYFQYLCLDLYHQSFVSPRPTVLSISTAVPSFVQIAQPDTLVRVSSGAFKRMLVAIHLTFALLCVHIQAVAITGISAGVNSATGARPFRREINEFSGSGAAWDLFILSLAQFQQSDRSSLLSYFQIAGEILRKVPARCDVPLMVLRYPWLSSHSVGWSERHSAISWILHA